MKRLFAILILTSIITTVLAQQKPSIDIIKKRFNLTFGIYNDSWQKVPDSISPRKVNPGFEISGLYNFPMDHKDRLNFFIGAGIASHSFYINSLIGEKKVATGVWNSYLYNVPSRVGAVDISYKVSKLVLTYFDVPFGFRYNFPNKVHATVGFKVGWRVNDQWKYKGSYYDASNNQFITGQQVFQKYSHMLNLANMHYGPYATIGYKWYGLSVFYQASSIYSQDRGPQMYPISIGLTFRPVR